VGLLENLLAVLLDLLHVLQLVDLHQDPVHPQEIQAPIVEHREDLMHRVQKILVLKIEALIPALPFLVAMTDHQEPMIAAREVAKGVHLTKMLRADQLMKIVVLENLPNHRFQRK
jgi:hypothetical protein